MSRVKNRFSAGHAIAWIFFAAGGTLSAFVLPVLGLTYIVLLFNPDRAAVVFETVSRYDSIPVRILFFAAVLLILWHAVHRLHLMKHDLQVRTMRKLISYCFYTFFAASCLWGVYRIIAIS